MTNTKQLRAFVNDLFQDVDNEARIDTDVANAICDVHAAKLEKLLQAREGEVRKEELKSWISKINMICLAIKLFLKNPEQDYHFFLQRIQMELEALKEEA